MSLFVDTVEILCKAGNGGDGYVSFHREKYVPNGGPDGGDGGRGGSVIFEADGNMHTLLDFRYRRKFLAADGERGDSGLRTGKSGTNLVIKVPVGTVIKDAHSGRVIVDLNEADARCAVLRGGRGGAGNNHFKNSVRQAPSFAKPGQKTPEMKLTLELKSIADVGLIGFPNVGKSTLLSVMTSARPKIANYHFTTLVPNLGVVRAGEDGFVLADIPGLIEGASQGAGLGHAFLRHVERTRLLVHVLDISGSEGRDPLEDLAIINAELEQYGRLSERPQIIAANKTDVGADEHLERLRTAVGEGVEVFPVSAATGAGVEALRMAIGRRLKELPMIELYEDETPADIPEDIAPFTIRRENTTFVVEGPLADSMMERVNIDNVEELAYLDRVLRRMGVIDALRGKGAKDGSSVRFGGLEFDFVE